MFARIGVLAAAALCVAPRVVLAEVSVNVAVANISIDNPTFAPRGQEENETVTALSSALRFTNTRGESEAATIDLTYRIEALRFGGNDESDALYHQLDSAATFEIVPDRFFIETLGLYNQMSSAPDQEFQFSNLNLGMDRTDIGLAEVRPYLRYEIGDRAMGVAEYSAQAVYQSGFDEAKLQRTLLTLGTASADIGATWNLEYAREWGDFGAEGGFEFQRIEAELGYWVASGVRLFTTQGLESDYRIMSSGLDERFWDVGVQWAPNSRMNLLAAYGERYFDDSAYRLEVTKTTRTGTVYLNYAQEPSTTNLRFFDIVRSLGTILVPDETLVVAGEDNAFIQERFQAGVRFEWPRSTIDLSVIKEAQLDPITDAGAAAPDEGLRGVTLSWTNQLSSRFSIIGAFELAERISGDVLSGDRFGRATLGIERTLGRRTFINAFLVREQSDPTETSTATKYTNNLFVLRFGLGFGQGEQAALSREWL